MSSAIVRVQKATSDLLIDPDWTMNMNICDSVNKNHWQAKEVVKAVRKRLQNKNPMVQLLSLTLLETMINNCGDYVHLQVAEKKVLQEMIKIVRKKNDIHVRDKILVLLDFWQQSFGGPMGKFPQYYWAYDELRRSGVEFPRRSVDAVPVFTSTTRQMPRHSLGGHGMPSNSTRTLDEAMASKMGSLSLSDLNSSWRVMELLTEMLQAMNPNDHESVKDDVIVDLVSRCRSTHKKLVQLLNSTRDEVLLGQGLALNDSLQALLAKHDAIASGSSLPTQAVGTSSNPIAHSATITSSLPNEASRTMPRVTAPAKAMAVSTCQIDEVDDDSAQLARRRSQMRPMSSQSKSAETATAGTPAVPASTKCNALALPDPPAPVRIARKEQDMIDLLSITLCTDSSSPRTTLNPPSSSSTLTPPSTSHEAEQPQAFLSGQAYPSSSQQNSVHQGQIANDSYIVPWAQPQHQPLPYTSSYSPTSRSTPASSHYSSPSCTHYSYETSQVNHTCQLSATTYPYPTSQANHSGQSFTATNSYQMSQANHMLHVARPMQYINSFGSSGNNTPSVLGDAQVSTNQRDVFPSTLQDYNSFGSRGNTHSAFGKALASANPSHLGPTTLQQYNSLGSRGNIAASTFGSPEGNKSFVPTYRLFEELVDLRTADGGMKTKSMASLSATSNQGMVGGWK